MKKTKILYWVFTILFAALMGFTAIPDVINSPDAVAFMTGHLGYPKYFTPFIGVAKLLGVVAILVPGFPKIREWAYAGLAFDLVGAIYSVLSVGDPVSGASFMLLPILLGTLSYVYNEKMKKAVPVRAFA